MKKYAIIDIETTGGRANRDRITEVAIVIHDGEKVLEEWESLIYPERTIPHNIIQITGITNEMVKDAPRFFEVAKKIVTMTEGAVFVAHNVRFDYNFIREEFKRLGFTYTRRQLCTVRLSRKAWPGLRSYSLGNLIRHFNINVDARHRAMADTKATVQLFEMIFDLDQTADNVKELVNLGIKESQLPVNITLDKLHEMPEECGVYYFLNKVGDIVYVGKSINIKKRVMEHFTDQTEKGRKLNQSVHEINYEITGSELVALLFESHEIKTHHPYINRAQRARSFQYAIISYKNQAGYICLSVIKANAKEKKKLNVLRDYPNLLSAKGALNQIIEQYELCHNYCEIDKTGTPCFYYHIHKCRGACIQEESAEDYNERIEEAIDGLAIDFPDNFILLDQGRTIDEKAVVLVEDGRYQGFGFAGEEDINGTIEDLKETIRPYAHNPDVARIIRRFLYRKKDLQVIKF